MTTPDGSRPAAGQQEALLLVCKTACDWAGEYGFSAPLEATEVLRAVFALCPEAMDVQDQEYFAKLAKAKSE